ncbi:MAG TPA: hypothetical protein VMQ60_05265 [Acidobacteriaceae bacterium]|nr:hypothetical protein [Acidobacteriaceae bacterium]
MNRKHKSRRTGAALGNILGRAAVVLLALLLAQAGFAHASVALLMEEPYGDFGAMNPTGHSAVYLNHICAASPTELRVCRPGESGVVISRYHKIDKLDWVAIPLIPYLYAVEDVSQVPQSVDNAHAYALRDAYRKKYLQSLAPDDAQGRAPKGEWTELVGESYLRTIHGFEIVSTAEQDQRFIALFNDRRNSGHFNILFHNCADFSRVVMDIYLPHAIHRSFVADVGITTPKQVARSLVEYGQKHPEVEMSAFLIPQVPGAIKRSKPVDGVAQSLVKSKKYLIPMTILTPELTGGLVVAYMVDGRMKLPKNALVFNVNDNEMEPGAPTPTQATNTNATNTNPDRTPLPSPAAAPAPAALATEPPASATPAALATDLPAAATTPAALATDSPQPASTLP